MPVECVCQNPTCGKTFVSYPAKIARGAGKYCSQYCFQMIWSLPWEIRFWAKVQRCTHEEWCPFCCWEWQGARNKRGYGRFNLSHSRHYLSSRLVLAMANRQTIPDHLNANHWCHNPACCNPWHLYVGTHEQNMLDMCKRFGFRYRTRQRLKEGRDSRPKGRPVLPAEERLWRRVIVCPHGPDCPYCCWSWKGSTKGYGYGAFEIRVKGAWKKIAASRMMWQLINNHDIPHGCFCLHHCDNTICTNPWHLYPGTHSENMKDASQRKRLFKPGDPRHFSKIRQPQIMQLWQLFHQGKTLRKIADILGISPSHVSRILRWQEHRQISMQLSSAPAIIGTARGERNGSAVLRAKDIPRIWQLRKQGHTQHYIAVELHVSPAAIQRVLALTHWAHVSQSFNAIQLSLFEEQKP